VQLDETGVKGTADLNLGGVRKAVGGRLLRTANGPDDAALDADAAMLDDTRGRHRDDPAFHRSRIQTSPMLAAAVAAFAGHGWRP
jgi:hypothetical protein